MVEEQLSRDGFFTKGDEDEEDWDDGTGHDDPNNWDEAGAEEGGGGWSDGDNDEEGEDEAEGGGEDRLVSDIAPDCRCCCTVACNWNGVATFNPCAKPG